MATNKDSLLDAWTKGGKGRQSEPTAIEGTGTAQKEPGDVLQWSVNLLKSHPENEKYFSPLDNKMFSKLKDDISQNGIHDALIVTEQNAQGERFILSGHNRFRAALELGLKTVPVREKKFSSDNDKIKFMIRDNAFRRHLSTEEKMDLISKIFADEIKIDRRGGDQKSEKSKVQSELSPIKEPEKSKVQSELSISGKGVESLSLAKRVSEAFGISESAAKKHLAKIRNPGCKTASGNTLKARQNAQERSERTQKGGKGQSLDEAKTRTKAYLNDIKKMNLTGTEKEIILDLINKFLK